MSLVAGLVPGSPGKATPQASTISAWRLLRGSPLASSSPAASETPMNVDRRSNRPVKKSEDHRPERHPLTASWIEKGLHFLISIIK
jgi:hypothetical protein